MRRWFPAVTVIAALLAAGEARASSADLFGFGSRSAALAQADVADADPAAAAFAGPAAAAEPGARVLFGYAHASPRVTFQGEAADIKPISGADLGVQYATHVAKGWSVGGALSLHLPDRGLARVAFRPGTEPTFVRLEASAHKTTADAVLAARYWGVSLAAGVAASASAGGKGADVQLPQDARGPYADGALDVDLSYRFAPVVAASVDAGLAQLGFRLRGASSLRATVDSSSRVDFRDNPLNGTTTVHVEGDAGYDPLSADLGLRAGPFGPVKAFFDLHYERWRSAPAPVASFSLDLRLGTSPSQLLADLGGAHLRDTLSPRLGVEVAPDGAFWAARAGYSYSPSALSSATGMLTLVDAPRHIATAGASLRADDVAGVDLSLDVHGALQAMTEQRVHKGNLALPFADYAAGGRIWQAGASLTGAFR